MLPLEKKKKKTALQIVMFNLKEDQQAWFKIWSKNSVYQCSDSMVSNIGFYNGIVLGLALRSI